MIHSIKLGEKTYTTIKVTALQTRKALEISREGINLGRMSEEYKSNPESLELVDNLVEAYQEYNSKNAALLCDIYGNKFTADELESNLSSEEIAGEIYKVVLGASSTISKN